MKKSLNKWYGEIEGMINDDDGKDQALRSRPGYPILRRYQYPEEMVPGSRIYKVKCPVRECQQVAIFYNVPRDVMYKIGHSLFFAEIEKGCSHLSRIDYDPPRVKWLALIDDTTGKAIG